MTVNAVNGAGQVYSPALGGAEGQLTPESLMFYCAANLRQLDNDIASRMNEQKSARDVQRAIGDAKAAIAAHKDKDWNELSPDQKERVLMGLKNAWAALPEGHPLRDKIHGMFHGFKKTACDNDNDVPFDIRTYEAGNAKHDANIATETEKDVHKNGMNKDEMNGLLANLDNVTETVSKGAELEMIQLQSMISQRQMAVQLTTNMLQKLNETLMAPIQNLK